MINDLRYALRQLIKNPGFTAVAVLTLALGIGANTAIFSIVNAVLLRPFPYQAPERLMIVQERISAGGFSPSYPNFVDWRAQNTAFESIAAVRGNESFNFTGAGEPERLQGRLVSAEFFSTLGIKRLLGRDFLAEEDRPGATPAVILSYGFWQRRFGADPDVLGKQLTLNHQSYTVVGITPAEFPVRIGSRRHCALWSSDATLQPARRRPGNRRRRPFETGRIAAAGRDGSESGCRAAGTTVSSEQQRAARAADAAARKHCWQCAPAAIDFAGCGRPGFIDRLRQCRQPPARSSSVRQKEMAVRVALGASRATLVRQLLTESVLLAALGATLGILLAFWGTGLITAQLPDGIPRLQEASVDAPVLGFTLAISLLTGLLFGLAPALQASRPSLTEGLKEGDRGSSGRRQRLRSVLVVGEVALTLTLLVGAGLLIQSFRRVLEVDPGFRPQNLLTMQVSVNKPNGPDGQEVANFFEQLQQNVRSLPGVTSVAVSNGIPFGSTNFPPFLIEGRPETENKPSGLRYHVSPAYFQTMGIELIKGRLFTAEDTPATPSVAIIDEVLARRYFPNEDPLGQRLKASADAPGIEIVGIVRHAEPNSLDAQGPPPAQFYFSFNQIPAERLPGYVRRINLLTRTEVEPLSLASAVRGQVAALNKDQAVFNVRTMEQTVAQSVAARRFSMLLLTVFGIVALALASIGIYGLMSYTVAQRTREIGVRMALGAQMSDVLKLMVGQGMKLAFVGVMLGLVASVALTQLMKTLLFGVSATDPLTFIAIALLLTVVALLACWLPARRATKVDPMIALRYE